MNSPFKHSSPWVRWLSIGIFVVVLLWVAQQILFKPIIEGIASNVIGARVTLGSFSLNPFTHQLRITNLQIYNEEGFPSKVFLNAPEILVETDLLEVMHGKLHFPLVIFSLDKMIIFKNALGKMNVNELKIVQEKLHDKTKGPAPNFKIDVLKLNMEQVVVEDDSKTPPLIEAYDLNLKDKTFNNVDGVPKLVGLIMFEALKPTALQGAGMYAATTLLGVGFLPGLAIGIAIANDKAVAEMPVSSGQLYQKCLQLIQQLGGQVKKSDAIADLISAKVYDCDVSIDIQNEGWFKSKITIKARKYFLAKPEIAAGILYQLKGGST